MFQAKSIILTILLMVLGVNVFAQTDTVRIQTSAVCETCKKAIEHNLSFEKGVKKSTLDLDTKVVTVIYKPDKTDPEKIRLAITKIGYDADSLKADPKGYDRLPECCKKPDAH